MMKYNDNYLIQEMSLFSRQCIKTQINIGEVFFFSDIASLTILF